VANAWMTAHSRVASKRRARSGTAAGAGEISQPRASRANKLLQAESFELSLLRFFCFQQPLKGTHVSKVIIPTVSRHVHFFPKEEDRGLMVQRGSQPLHAVVIFVINERTVNLAITDHDGFFHTRIGVALVQPGDELHGGSYCQWMDYQINQARQTITEADALADLAGTPRPDNPTVAKTDGLISETVANLIGTTALSLGQGDLADSGVGADLTPAAKSEGDAK
jgi:hypothetical protein